MAKTEQQVVIEAPIERVYDVIVDFERYPEFLPEIRTANVLSHGEGVWVVAFELEIIMRIGYTLRLLEERPTALTWSLDSAKMLSVNRGGWQLEDLGDDRTRATYGIELKFRGLIPKSVSTRLVGTTLPATLDRFKLRAEQKG